MLTSHLKFSVLGCSLLLFAPTLSADDPGDELGDLVSERQLLVVDEDGRPIQDAQVTVSVSDLPKAELLTDEDGIVRFRYLDMAGVGFQVFKEGHPQMRWYPARRGEQLPEQLEIVLPPGIPVGGSVVDERGRPIEGAEVRISVSEVRAGSRSPNRAYSAIEHYIVHTDAEGRWETDIFPRTWRNLVIWVSHPDYIVWAFAPLRRPEGQSLVSRDWQVVLERGVKLTGVVRDERARPIPGAALTYGPVEKTEHFWDVIQTDDDGEFTFGAMPPGNYAYVVVAKGYTPRQFRTPVSAGTPPLRIRLAEGQKLSVQFVDENQQPIKNARVRLWNWVGDEAALAAGVGRELDEEGRWFWDGMPAEPFQLRVYSDDYVTEEFPITPDRTDYVYALESAQKVHYDLHVVDKQTGDPIGRIDFFAFSRNLPLYEHYHSFGSEDGRFSTEVPTPYGPSSIRIEAVGYQPRVFGSYTTEDSPITIEAALVPKE